MSQGKNKYRGGAVENFWTRGPDRPKPGSVWAVSDTTKSGAFGFARNKVAQTFAKVGLGFSVREEWRQKLQASAWDLGWSQVVPKTSEGGFWNSPPFEKRER